jgi:tRNA threonylcarbamoyl adenosine modification protein (Sua5/YciO/YrdC/YwlC family)
MAVRAGDCVVLPTDTVYGIGADALCPAAVARLLEAKRRGADMPPPVLIADTQLLDVLADDLSQAARVLADEFWPGALTLVVKARPALGMDTVAVRIPDNETARALLRATGPLAVSSANVSGRPPATDAAAASEQLGEAVAVYLDDGPTPGETPSTIVDATDDRLRILRQGAIPAEAISRFAVADG